MRRAVASALRVVAAAASLAGGAALAGEPLVPFEIAGDAIKAPLGGLAGDAANGRRIVLDREVGNCLICHAVPEPSEPFMGDVGPHLGGVGSRLTAGQIRLRLVDPTRLNAGSLMPALYRVEGLTRVAARWRGEPVLSAQQIEDVIAYLVTLRE